MSNAKNPGEHGQAVGGFQFKEIAGNVTLEAKGDIVGGDKTVIQLIQNRYELKLASQPLRKAPYKFLAYYDIPDQDIFFGRASSTKLLSGLVPRHKVVFVNGSSGAGKSSLLNAGLIPSLADHGYAYVRFRDYSDPIQQLRSYFRKSPDLDVSNPDSLTLATLIRKARAWPGHRVLLALDQFERFLSIPEESRRAFITDLRACLVESDLTTDEVNIVIAVRQEFLGPLLAEIDEIIPDLSNESYTLHLRSLTKDEAREAIMMPVTKFAQNIFFEREFVDDVLLPHLIGQSRGEDRIEPSHLQIVCNQLYEAAVERISKGTSGVTIGTDLYRELGQAGGILQGYLDRTVELVAGGDATKIKVVRSVLKLMISSSGTRRFVTLNELRNALPDVPD